MLKVKTGGSAIALPLEKVACKLRVGKFGNELSFPPILVELRFAIIFVPTYLNTAYVPIVCGAGRLRNTRVAQCITSLNYIVAQCMACFVHTAGTDLCSVGTSMNCAGLTACLRLIYNFINSLRVLIASKSVGVIVVMAGRLRPLVRSAFPFPRSSSERFERREGLVDTEGGKPLGFERGLPSHETSLGRRWSVYMPRALYP